MSFNVEVQKIDGTMLETYGMLFAIFLVTDKSLGCFSSPLSDVNVDFLDRELRSRIYTTQEALPTTRRVEIVGKKEFAAIALDPEYETYVVQVGPVSSDVSLSSSPLDVHPTCRTQSLQLQCLTRSMRLI